MTDLILSYRLIDRQEQLGTIQEIYEGPDKRRARFFARVRVNPIAYSQVWTTQGWVQVHSLLDPGKVASEAITRLIKATEDILGWDEQGPKPPLTA